MKKNFWPWFCIVLVFLVVAMGLEILRLREVKKPDIVTIQCEKPTDAYRLMLVGVDH